MSTTALWKANVLNQSALWKLMGATPVEVQGEQWWQSNSWPYRLWPDSMGASVSGAEVQTVLQIGHCKTVVPVWTEQGTNEVCADYVDGLTLSGQLVQMYLDLKLEHSPGYSPSITLLDVCDDAMLHDWWQICQQAFGYDIDIKVIRTLRGHNEVRLLLATQGKQAVGTAVLYKTGNVVGLHQLGVAKAVQGQGVARQMMEQLIPMARQWQASYMMLQASSAGLGLYEKLGFERQGVLHNFRLCNQG